METETTVDKKVDGTQRNEETRESLPEVTPASFNIHIKCINPDGTINGLKDIQIRVKRTDLIAAVKQKYIDSGLCEFPDYIVLQYNGNELLDNTTVMENNLHEDCTVFHQYSNVTPFSKVNYGELARMIHEEALKNKDYHHAGFDPVYGVWDQTWDKGDEWETYPTVMVPDVNEMSKKVAIIPKPSRFNPMASNEYPNRVFKSMFVSVVGGFLFEVMHRLEGRWSGMNIVPSEELGGSSPVTSCELRFDPHGCWIETRNSVDQTGLVSTRTIRYIPIGNGKLRVEMSDGMYAECRIETMEISPYLVMTTAVDSHSGKPLLVESVTIVDNMSHVRTIQDFSPVGNITDVFVINERRVVDPSTSELTPYSGDLKPQSI